MTALLTRARTRARYRLYRHARVDPRQLPVFHPGQVDRLRRAGYNAASPRSKRRSKPYVNGLSRLTPIGIADDATWSTSTDVRFRSLCSGDARARPCFASATSCSTNSSMATCRGFRRRRRRRSSPCGASETIIGGAGNVARNIAASAPAASSWAWSATTRPADLVHRALPGPRRRSSALVVDASRPTTPQGAVCVRAFPPTCCARTGNWRTPASGRYRAEADRARHRRSSRGPIWWCCPTTPRAC